MKPYRKYSRENTKEEKKKMMKARKKRRQLKGRQRGREVELKQLEDQKKETEKEVIKYKGMAQSFWERWQWELAKRKEEARMSPCVIKRVSKLLEIDPKYLVNLDVDDENELYIGRGSFSVVKYQLYRGMPVAVKELLPGTLLRDLEKEASLMSQFCHPCLPHLFGICTTHRPYRIVMQYHALPNGNVTTIETATRTSMSHLYPFVSSSTKCHMIICTQVFEGLEFLHQTLKVLHNDIKANNVLLSMMNTSTSCALQAILIDFGMAKYIKDVQILTLSEMEKRDWFSRYSHIAPEVIEGKVPQTEKSDIYSAGGIIRRVAEGWKKEMNEQDYKLLSKTAAVCRSTMYTKRPIATNVLTMLQDEHAYAD